jgi:hypothetical protein
MVGYVRLFSHLGLPKKTCVNCNPSESNSHLESLYGFLRFEVIKLVVDCVL